MGGRYEKPVYMRYDEDEEILECTACLAEFDPDGQGIVDWNYCPVCGNALKWVDGRPPFDGEEEFYRAISTPARQLTESDRQGLKMLEFRLGGAV